MYVRLCYSKLKIKPKTFWKSSPKTGQKGQILQFNSLLIKIPANHFGYTPCLTFFKPIKRPMWDHRWNQTKLWPSLRRRRGPVPNSCLSFASTFASMSLHFTWFHVHSIWQGNYILKSDSYSVGAKSRKWVWDEFDEVVHVVRFLHCVPKLADVLFSMDLVSLLLFG